MVHDPKFDSSRNLAQRGLLVRHGNAKLVDRLLHVASFTTHVSSSMIGVVVSSTSSLQFVPNAFLCRDVVLCASRELVPRVRIGEWCLLRVQQVFHEPRSISSRCGADITSTWGRPSSCATHSTGFAKRELMMWRRCNPQCW